MLAKMLRNMKEDVQGSKGKNATHRKLRSSVHVRFLVNIRPGKHNEHDINQNGCNGVNVGRREQRTASFALVECQPREPLYWVPAVKQDEEKVTHADERVEGHRDDDGLRLPCSREDSRKHHAKSDLDCQCCNRVQDLIDVRHLH
jgi:hypothetical protein